MQSSPGEDVFGMPHPGKFRDKVDHNHIIHVDLQAWVHLRRVSAECSE